MHIPRSRSMTAVAGGAVAALALAACSSSGDPGSPPRTGAITVNGSEPQHPLYVADTNESGGNRIIQLLFRGLVSYDEKGKPVMAMAESIDTTDAKTFTVKLKAGNTFSNGEPVDAKSFVDAWNYGALVTNAQQNSSFFAPIEGYDAVHPTAAGTKPTATTVSGLKVVDANRFTITLKAATAGFPLRLGYSPFFPLPQAAYKDVKAYGQAPIGNGPYVLDGAWEHNVSIKVKKNPDYKGSDSAKNDGVAVRFYLDAGSAYNDLLANNLDVLDALPDAALATFQTDLGDRAVNQPSGVFQSFSFPLYQPQWQGAKSAKIRQAISMAVDRDSITRAIFQGTRTPAKDFSSPVVQGYSPDICGELCTYQPDKARALLAEAGGFTGKLTIAYNADGSNKASIDAICNSIKNTLAISCVGKSYPDFKSLRDPVTTFKMDGAYRSGWQMDYPSLENFLKPIYSTGASANTTKYTNPAFDALLRKGDTAESLDEAVKSYQEAERILTGSMPAIPLWYSNTTAGYAKTVSNVRFDIFGVPVYTDITRK